MSKRIGTLAFAIALGVFATAWFSGAAQAGPASVCGDNVEEGNETCDDGNTVGGDGCSADCIDEICGDNVLEPVTEECDDGNTVAGDGCAADCSCEAEVCGDGIDGCLEACDDGNTINGDGCENDCTVTPPPPTDVQEPKQQACINAINKNLAGVIKAQNADNATCIKDVSNGKQPNPAACYGTDLKGKVGKAQTKTTNTNGKKCNDAEEVPDFAYTDPATVNNAGETEVLAAATAVLGAAPNVILKADKPGAKCQQEIMKQLGALSNKVAAEANKAKKNLLKGKGVTQVASAAELATGIDAATATTNPKIAAAENKVNTGIGNKCDDAQANAAVDCNGADTANEVTLCVIAAAKQGACEALEAADGLDLNCPTVPTP